MPATEHHAHGHDHGHDHSHSHHDHPHNHENIDYGKMYSQPWVQAMVKQIQDYLVENAEWVGIDPTVEQRVLDYACGHGTISLGVIEASPKAVCRGIDLDASQMERYNSEAGKVLGKDAAARMFGIQGDLYHPSEAMEGPEWSNFDIAIMSMALHHVPDPIDMLRRLKQRIRPGGILIIVEFLGKDDSAEMLEVHAGKQKIWPGFGAGKLGEDMKTAGFEGFEFKMLEQPAYVPKEARGESFGEEQWCFFAKAVVPEE